MDVIRFLEGNNISYKTSGPNCAKGHVVIKCPFCGDDDPSEHMGWELATGYWGCWRNSGHRGRRPHRLIMRLLGCTPTAADDIVAGVRDLDRFGEAVAKLRAPAERSGERGRMGLELPRNFRPLTSKGLGRHYCHYLRRRGFRRRDLDAMREQYDLRFCTSGLWRGRIIFPVRLEGSLVTWTGRTISRIATPRYLTLTQSVGDDGGPQALCGIRDTLWGYDSMIGEKFHTLCIVEGPIDALKVDFYGGPMGVRASCLFGSGITEEQIALVADLCERCTSIVFLGDSDGLANAMHVQRELSFLQSKFGGLPKHVDDPGAMSPGQVRRFAQSCVSGEV